MQIFSVGNFIGEFVDEGSLVLTTPKEIIVDQIRFHQFGVGERNTIDRGSLVGVVFRSQSLSFRRDGPVKPQLGSLDVLGALQNGLPPIS